MLKTTWQLLTNSFSMYFGAIIWTWVSSLVPTLSGNQTNLKKRTWFCQMASGNLLNLRTFLSEEKLLMEQGMALDTQVLETPMSSPFFLSLKILTLIKPFQEMLRRGSSLNLKIVHFLSNKVYAIGNGIKPEPPNSKSEYLFK